MASRIYSTRLDLAWGRIRLAVGKSGLASSVSSFTLPFLMSDGCVSFVSRSVVVLLQCNAMRVDGQIGRGKMSVCGWWRGNREDASSSFNSRDLDHSRPFACSALDPSWETPQKSWLATILIIHLYHSQSTGQSTGDTYKSTFISLSIYQHHPAGPISNAVHRSFPCTKEDQGEEAA